MGNEKNLKLPQWSEYRIIHKGNIDINGLFAELPKWFNSFQYDFWEKGMTQKDIGTGFEYMSDWIASREINDYVKFDMTIQIFLKHINKVKVDGKDMFHCETQVMFNSTMTKNYRDSFGKDWLQESMRQIYERYVRYHDLDEYGDKLGDESLDIVNMIKSFLH